MSERFTKGPWTAKYEASLPMCMTIRGGKNNSPIAYISAFVPTGIGEDYADGKLIAAAPEMYEMLDAIEPILRSASKGVAHDDKHVWPETLSGYAATIKKLLAKARGEA